MCFEPGRACNNRHHSAGTVRSALERPHHLPHHSLTLALGERRGLVLPVEALCVAVEDGWGRGDRSSLDRAVRGVPL